MIADMNNNEPAWVLVIGAKKESPMERLGKIAYNAYCKQAGGVSLISGDKLPEFEVLKPEIQDAWDAAAAAAVNEIVGFP